MGSWLIRTGSIFCKCEKKQDSTSVAVKSEPKRLPSGVMRKVCMGSL